MPKMVELRIRQLLWFYLCSLTDWPSVNLWPPASLWPWGSGLRSLVTIDLLQGLLNIWKHDENRVKDSKRTISLCPNLHKYLFHSVQLLRQCSSAFYSWRLCMVFFYTASFFVKLVILSPWIMRTHSTVHGYDCAEVLISKIGQIPRYCCYHGVEV